MKTIRVVGVAMFIVGGSAALHVVGAQQAGAKRTELQRHGLSPLRSDAEAPSHWSLWASR